jgi:hypothetical protein
MSLTNTEIEYLCTYLKIPLVACCLQHELETMKVKDGGYVINYGSYENGGTHYIALYKMGDSCVVFDSFGAPIDLTVLHFIRSVKNKAYNEWIIQDVNDDHCGFYCCAFLYYCMQSTNPDQLIPNANNFINLFESENNLERLKIIFNKYIINPAHIPYFDKNIYKKIKK